MIPKFVPSTFAKLLKTSTLTSNSGTSSDPEFDHFARREYLNAKSFDFRVPIRVVGGFSMNDGIPIKREFCLD